MRPYYCPVCEIRSASAYSHRTLGPLCPVCLRPMRKKGRGGSGSPNRRRQVAIRDMWQCHLCGGFVDPKAKGVGAPSVDHVVPVSQGGSNAMENLRLAHVGCNSARGNAPVGMTQRQAVRKAREEASG